jgi:tRNA-2-methylthio-N6-dimethylallyladenosine synthase
MARAILMDDDTAKFPTGGATYFIRTFGCQMNVADSLHYAKVLESLGCVRCASEESADILVVNTCSVRAKAEEKAISYVGAMMRKRGEYRGSARMPDSGGIAFVGCMATVRGDEIRRRFPEVRMILPAKEIDSFEDRLVSAFPELMAADRRADVRPVLRPEERFERFVPIVRGCANRCTYCIVPAARGGQIESRHPDEIFREVEELLNLGIKSVTFLGQNVCAYGTDITDQWPGMRDGYGFPHLLLDIKDRFASSGTWFKFLTSHPRDFSDELIGAVASSEAFSKGFHLPLQAGDDEVLARMGRGYTSERYRNLISRIRTKIPDMRLTTDLIVGFPGEDESAFERTMEMVRDIGFDSAFTFLYSPRAGTPAEKWADPVPPDEKKRRLQALIESQNEIAMKRAESHVGEERIVLVEGPATGSSTPGTGFVVGRTREGEVVIFPGDENDYGKFVRVRLTDAHLRSYVAERDDEQRDD